MSGPVGIVNHLSVFAKIGFKKLLWFVVFINVNLAILNLLPIPVLDGGHMLFATIEKFVENPYRLPFSKEPKFSLSPFFSLSCSMSPFLMYNGFFRFSRNKNKSWVDDSTASPL